MVESQCTKIITKTYFSRLGLIFHGIAWALSLVEVTVFIVLKYSLDLPQLSVLFPTQGIEEHQQPTWIMALFLPTIFKIFSGVALVTSGSWAGYQLRLSIPRDEFLRLQCILLKILVFSLIYIAVILTHVLVTTSELLLSVPINSKLKISKEEQFNFFLQIL